MATAWRHSAFNSGGAFNENPHMADCCGWSRQLCMRLKLQPCSRRAAIVAAAPACAAISGLRSAHGHAQCPEALRRWLVPILTLHIHNVDAGRRHCIDAIPSTPNRMSRLLTTGGAS